MEPRDRTGATVGKLAGRVGELGLGAQSEPTVLWVQWLLSGRLLESLSRDLLAGERMDPTVFTVISSLWIYGTSEPVTVARLEQLVIVSPSGISRALQRAEREGLVAKVPNAGDARSFHIELTSAGKRTAKRLMKHMATELQRRLGEPTPEAMLYLAGAAERMSTALER